MFEINFIRNVLKQYVDHDVKKFIIYPFGVNGVNVKNVLKDCFDLEPCCIIDNEYCRYNSNIINSDLLQDVYQKEMYLICTIENKDINAEILKKLIEYIPKDNIINLYEVKMIEEQHNKEKIKKHHGEGFLLCDFLPLLKAEKDKTEQSGKIRVRIAHSSINNWNAISRICQEFIQDTSFDVLVIISACNSKKRAIQQVQECGYTYVLWENYQIEKDEPDILILTGREDSIVTEGICCRRYAKLIVVAYMYLVIYTVDSVKEFWEWLEMGFGRHRPDYYLFDSLLYKELRKTPYFSANMIEMGNAKFDGIYQAIQKKEYPSSWGKLGGRKTIVVWATSHGIYNNVITSNVTFDLYAKTIFEYISNHQEVGLIFRPHSVFIDEMLVSGYWTENDIESLKRYCNDCPNIVFDDTDTYNTALSIADGILTDAYCGIICSALPTLKPICAMHRFPESSASYQDLWNICYSAYEEQDIIDFFEMIRNRSDPMLELRERASRELVRNFDGKNSWRIKEFIKKEYIKKEEKLS